MPSNVDVLVEMGFPQNRAEKALARTNFKGVEAAMEWLFNHSEDPDIDEPFEAPKGNTLASAQPTLVLSDPAAEQAANAEGGESSSSQQEAAAAAQAQSLKCDECGKQLRTEIDVQAHAARTGHSSFSESTEEVKPLTAEEKARQMQLVQEKIKQKRVEREEKEKREAKEKEKIRRVQGKDLTMAKFELEQKEMRILAEAKRREKADTKAAKQKALDDIRRDKERRAAARAAEKGETPQASSQSTAAPVPSTSTTVTEPAAKKEYTECRLQANESLAAVRLYTSMNVPSPLEEGFTFMTTFPRKVYSEEDMEKPLSTLGLVPSSVIMVTKRSL